VAFTTVKIVFESGRAGNADIYSMNANGTGVTQLTTYYKDDIDPSWSPDGTKIAFTGEAYDPSVDDYSNQVITMNNDGTGQAALTSDQYFNKYQPDWSPDGRGMAVVSPEVYVAKVDADGVIECVERRGGAHAEAAPPKLVGFGAHVGEVECRHAITSAGSAGTPSVALAGGATTAAACAAASSWSFSARTRAGRANSRMKPAASLCW